MITFSILICALNEEKNIENIISQCFGADLNKKIILDKIIIVSDGSTDSTNEIISKLQKKYSNLELIINSERLGKALAFNIGKKSISSDWLVSIDADIKIDKYLFIELFKNISTQTGLIGGNPIPTVDSKKIAHKVGYFSYSIVNNIKGKIDSGNNFYSAHGRCLALEKYIYQKIQLIDSAGTDQFMFFYTLSQDKKFLFNKDAKVFYKLPEILTDYTKQNVRFHNTAKTMENHFGKKLVLKAKYIPLKIKMISLLQSFITRPISGFLWGFMFTYGKVKSYFSQPSTGKWEVSNSTK